MGNGKRPVDFGMAEALAFGTLLRQGTPVRLSGQDSRRGTFNQRHAALIDTENEEIYLPLAQLTSGDAFFEIYNSTLSEAGILGFEYGFSRDFPEALVLWEAQFGDFANGAQIIIDQFIAAGEDKWNLLSGVVLLLPHGYEGQGPEHSSARIERYLQLAARDNIQICQPSNAAQYFHLLRRQALRSWRKPLVVFTPKSMLRNPVASSPLSASSQRAIPNGNSRRRSTKRRESFDLHRKNRPRTNSRKKEKEGHRNRNRIPRATLPVPRIRTNGRVRPPRNPPATSSGCKKNRPTWAPSLSCCRAWKA